MAEGATRFPFVALARDAVVSIRDPQDLAHLSAASDVKPGLVIRRL